MPIPPQLQGALQRRMQNGGGKPATASEKPTKIPSGLSPDMSAKSKPDGRALPKQGNSTGGASGSGFGGLARRAAFPGTPARAPGEVSRSAGVGSFGKGSGRVRLSPQNTGNPGTMVKGKKVKGVPFGANAKVGSNYGGSGDRGNNRGITNTGF